MAAVDKNGNELDPLQVLVDERGEELRPAMRAFIAVVRAWLGLGSVLGFITLLGFATTLMAMAVPRFGIYAAVIYFVVAMPLTFAGWWGLKKLRRKIAAAISARIERGLDSIGGSSTPMMLSLRSEVLAREVERPVPTGTRADDDDAVLR